MEGFVAFGRYLPRTPPLERQTARTRGLAFADAERARSFTPPKVTSETGAVILARLRRDGYDWRTRQRALSVPTLVIHGEEDALPVAVSAELVALLPRAERQLVPHAGHKPFSEAPDVFFSVVDSFLAAPFPGAVRRSV
jgi:proline iminopeptidase